MRSRFEGDNGGVERLVEVMRKLGFDRKELDRTNKMFLLAEFRKSSRQRQEGVEFEAKVGSFEEHVLLQRYYVSRASKHYLLHLGGSSGVSPNDVFSTSAWELQSFSMRDGGVCCLRTLKRAEGRTKTCLPIAMRSSQAAVAILLHGGSVRKCRNCSYSC